MFATPKPYRIVVSANGFQRGCLYAGRGSAHKGAYTKITPIRYGYILWTEDQTVGAAARLPGAGSFAFVKMSLLFVLYQKVNDDITRKPATLFDLSGEF